MRPRNAAQQTAEHRRLAESPTDEDPWRLWGPYVAGRQWGTVREDYSADGNAWASFPFDQAHTRAYRWGEDGIGGLCDRYGFLNLAVALWNGRDDRLKERWFGVTNPQGNHGEDVKEFWWDLDATPTHSWAQQVYRYPQAAYPYAALVEGNAARTRSEREFELADTGVLGEDRFFDVTVTHAKGSPDDVCVRITATNHGPDAAPLDIVPQLWFRNTWSWGRDDRRPSLREVRPPELSPGGLVAIEAEHGFLGRYRLYARGVPDLMFCDNETDDELAFGRPRRSPYPTSAVDRAIVHGDRTLLNPARTGTKVALRYHFASVAPGETVTVDLRLADEPFSSRVFGDPFASVLENRRQEADEFYAALIPAGTPPEDTLIARRAFAGLLWGRQLYRYPVAEWLEGDPVAPPPPPRSRNTGWQHLYLADIISMPDAWEYPWFAAWDLAFHCVALAHVDPAFAKNQLILMCREWAQHPDGQLPAYEWDFGDVNPPVHAWAAWQVYLADGAWDHEFLVRVFTKLLLNFGWWVNRTDLNGTQLFEGGFLGMDNIGLFDRSRDVPDGWVLEQSDATSWMAFFCLSMLKMAFELSRKDDAWDDLATTFAERFVAIAEAMDAFGPDHTSLWDEEDGFYYDVLVHADGTDSQPLRVRSLVGLLPLLAVAVAPDWVGAELPDFTARLRWLQRRYPGRLAELLQGTADDSELTFAVVPPGRFRRVVARMFDEEEFLSPHGIRSLSAAYRGGHCAVVAGEELPIAYVAGESDSPMFGGNSNWRGPVWFPINVLLVDALHTYARAGGKDERVEVPTGSGHWLRLEDAAYDLERRLVDLFRSGPDGRRPGDPYHQPTGPLWSHPTFSEYFDGDDG
ncbi:MAG: glucosidase, partial [Nigerium sp.]|nr:glucosidase [Nigerium sp.]